MYKNFNSVRNFSGCTRNRSENIQVGECSSRTICTVGQYAVGQYVKSHNYHLYLNQGRLQKKKQMIFALRKLATEEKYTFAWSKICNMSPIVEICDMNKRPGAAYDSNQFYIIFLIKLHRQWGEYFSKLNWVFVGINLGDERRFQVIEKQEVLYVPVGAKKQSFMNRLNISPSKIVNIDA